jgi:hypothetical protein
LRVFHHTYTTVIIIISLLLAYCSIFGVGKVSLASKDWLLAALPEYFCLSCPGPDFYHGVSPQAGTTHTAVLTSQLQLVAEVNACMVWFGSYLMAVRPYSVKWWDD